jgi:hypothetical protein
MNKTREAFAIVCAALTTSVLAMAPAEAAKLRGDGYSTVTAKSRYGVQTISGLTRPSTFGREVRLPGGTWIDCAGDCRETLREETIDFFYKLQERSGDGAHRR